MLLYKLSKSIIVATQRDGETRVIAWSDVTS